MTCSGGRSGAFWATVCTSNGRRCMWIGRATISRGPCGCIAIHCLRMCRHWWRRTTRHPRLSRHGVRLQAGHQGSTTADAPSSCGVACLGSAAGGARPGVDVELGRAVSRLSGFLCLCGGHTACERRLLPVPSYAASWVLRATVMAQGLWRVSSRLQVWSSVTKG